MINFQNVFYKRRLVKSDRRGMKLKRICWEPLFPLLFILFINDVCNSLDTDKLTDKAIELLSMYNYAAFC